MLNLESLNIVSVAAIGAIDLEEGRDQSLNNILIKHQTGWPDSAIDKLGFSEIDGVRHHVGLDVEIDSERNPDEASFLLEVHSFHSGEHFDPNTRAAQEKQFEEIEAILSDLADLESHTFIHSHVAWRFPPNTRRSIINLPLMTMQSAALPFTEVSGIRLKKRTDQGLTAVIIDLQEDRSLAVRLMLPATPMQISEEIIETIAQLGMRVIEDFILDIVTEEGDIDA